MDSARPARQLRPPPPQDRRRFVRSAASRCARSAPRAVMIRRELFDAVGLFDESYPACEDYEMWLRVTARYPVGLLREPLLVKYGGHPDQLSSTVEAARPLSNSRDRKNFGIQRTKSLTSPRGRSRLTKKMPHLRPRLPQTRTQRRSPRSNGPDGKIYLDISQKSVAFHFPRPQGEGQG